MAITGIELDQQVLIDRYQPLIDQEKFSKRQLFELCRDVLRVRRLNEVTLNGQNIGVELEQKEPEELSIEFKRIDSETDEETTESWNINSYPRENRGQQRFETSFCIRTGMQVSFVAGEVSGLGMNVPDVNLKLTSTHTFKLAKAVWDAHLNSPQG